jgi:hypothetical protein
MRFVILIFLLQLSAFSQVIFQKPLSDRVANYQIKASLDCQKKMITATEKLIWRNSSQQSVRELQFHLYMNAFRNDSSTFLSPSRKRHPDTPSRSREELGGVDIQRFILNNRYDLLRSIEYIQPNDSNQYDSTVIQIKLPQSVRPGGEVSIEMDFTCKLPKIIERTGYKEDFFLLGQWFPKIGVFRDGKWHCHQFFPNSEFFADFGVYQVELTLPKEYIVGATGILMQEESGDSLKTLYFRAEDVHDFAMVAWPKFQQETREIENVRVILLYAPEHSGQKERYMTAITDAIRHLNGWLSPYPYPQITVVDPPLYAFRAGGMEYPCFITSFAVWGIPAEIRFFSEEVTIHEYAHQYFYGILASNEAEEPWLDEGFTCYATLRIMNQAYGASHSLSELYNIQISQIDQHKRSYLRQPDREVVQKASWEFLPKTYGVSTYDKPALILQTLENFLGRAKMDTIMQMYYQKWKFRHPQTGDFLALVDSISGQDLGWYFDQALLSTKILDYAVDSLSSEETVTIDSNNGEATVNYHNRVVVKRLGDFIFPVEISCTFDNGDTLKENWDGADTVHVLNYYTKSRLSKAQIDPKHRILLDLNWSNNGMLLRKNYSATIRHWLQTMKLYQQALLGVFFL